MHNTQTCPGPISFSADFHWFIDFPRDGRNEISWYVLLKNMGARQRYHQGPKSIKSLYSPIFRYFDGTPDVIPIMNQGAEFTRNPWDFCCFCLCGYHESRKLQMNTHSRQTMCHVSIQLIKPTDFGQNVPWKSVIFCFRIIGWLFFGW